MFRRELSQPRGSLLSLCADPGTGTRNATCIARNPKEIRKTKYLRNNQFRGNFESPFIVLYQTMKQKKAH